MANQFRPGTISAVRQEMRREKVRDAAIQSLTQAGKKSQKSILGRAQAAFTSSPQKVVERAVQKAHARSTAQQVSRLRRRGV